LKLVTYQTDGPPRIGAVQEEQIIDLTSLAATMLELIAMGADGLERAAAHTAAAETAVPLTTARLLPPIPRPPRNVMCLGLNYAEHAQESYGALGQEVKLPAMPIVFTKSATAVNGPYDDIPYDPAVSTLIDWEAELAVIIGRRGINIPAAEANSNIFGYTVLNDVSARDLQRGGKQYFKGKSLDGSCPIGPWIVTADEIPDPHALAIRCRVNGETKQQSNTRHMIFDIPTTIAYLSRGMALLPGDIIATGTPDGVGFARTPPEYLAPGDVVECEVERIGVIRNTIGAAP